MKFNSREIKEAPARAREPQNREQRRNAKFWKNAKNAAKTVGRIAAAGAAVFVLSSPLISGNANADGIKKGKGVHEPIELSLEYGDEAKAEAALRAIANNPKRSEEEREKARKAADELAAKRNAEEGVEEGETPQFPGDRFDYTEQEREEAFAAMEGMEESESGEPETGKEKPKEAPEAEEGEPLEGSETEEDGDSPASHNFIFKPTPEEMSRYLETNLAPIPGLLGIRGEKGRAGLEQPVQVGVRTLSNEAGDAVFGMFGYLNLIRVDLGAAMFVNRAMVPIGRLMLSPELNIRYNKKEKAEGYVKMGYYGSAAFAGNLPSWVYSSHSAGLGWSQDAGKNFTLRLAGIIGGALSYPAWDDIFFNFSTGLSMDFAKTVLIYGAPTCYFAANTPMETAYIGYYEPKFQDVEVGVQVMIPGGVVGRAFADVGLVGDSYGILNRYGFKLTKIMSIPGKLEADFWGVIGMTQWSPVLGGGVDPVIMTGINFSFSEERIRHSYSSELSYARMLDTEAPVTDIPTAEHPGPYGFGRSGDPYYDVPINEAKDRITDSITFRQFKSGYSGASNEEVLVTARFIGAFMQQVAYANGAYDSLTTGNIFDGDVKYIASRDHEDIFNYLQSYIRWYQTHAPGEQLPQGLRDGIAMCSGIHSLVTDFLNANGIDAVTISVNTPDGPHMVTAARVGGKNVVLDYGNQVTADGDFQHMYDAYGQYKGAPTFKSQVYGPDGKYMGTLNTSAERLLRGAIGIDNKEMLLRNYLGVY